MIGVSPAFMVSLYGPGFSIGNFCEGLRLVKEIGFSAYQPEILVGTALPEWVHDARSVHRTASDLGLVPTQFVAHFMLEEFSNPEKLNPRSGIDELKQVLDIMQVFSPMPGAHHTGLHLQRELGFAGSNRLPVVAGGASATRRKDRTVC